MKTELPRIKADCILQSITLPMIFLLFAATLQAKPIDYDNVENLLPTEPQTTNETLVAIVEDPVVQDAVQNAVGNGSLQGLVVRKKVLVMPASESTKVVSQREQVLVVPITHLEDVRKNITETATEEDAGSLAEVRSLTDENEYEGTEPPQHKDLYEVLGEIPRKPPTVSVDTPQEVLDILRVPDLNREDKEVFPVSITVSIVAFLDPARISSDKINMPIVAILPERAGIAKDHLKNQHEIVQNGERSEGTILGGAWSSSQIQTPSSLIHPAWMTLIPKTRQYRGIDVATSFFWMADVNGNYSKNHDMDVAADIVFRPLFRYRQEAQRRSYRRPAYREHYSYGSYPNRDYYKPRYSSDYYY